MGIFEPFRAIGYITNSVPFSVQRLGTETFVTVSVGKSWQIYNCAKLNLVLVGPQFPKKIRALASYRDYTFAAYGSEIAVCKRAHQVATWSAHKFKVRLLFLFGEHILSVDAKGNLHIWAFKGIEEHLEPVGHLTLEDGFTPACIIHPDTYLNKIIIGSQEGSLQLWNVSTKKKLYDFKGWNSPITCCLPSPALDVVAVGCADGKIHVHNIRFDEEIVNFTHSTRGAVTTVSFCTDGQPLLASGGSSGVISIWNLEKRKLHSIIREAHDSAIVSLHFFANEPVLLSASADNSMKMWIFDTSDGDPRLLRFRSGHSAPPLCIRFYANGKHILSAGQDRAFRLFSVIQDQQSRELSQRHVSKRAKKLKLSAYVWRLQNFVLGEHILKPSAEIRSPVKACAISACGNFAVIGTASGWIERFNLQSGFSRGSYIDTSEKGACAHGGDVVGVACDSTNTLMISAGYHGDIKVWDFKARGLKSRWEVGCALVKIVYHRPNGLLATLADDFVIRLYDVVALRLVRKFEGHTDRVTDMCFSEDGKWLLSSSMDGSLRVWDVILARQIDAVLMDVAITALSLSPNMDVLATTHVDQNGAMFSGGISIDAFASGKEVVHVNLPSVSSNEGLNDMDVDETATKSSPSKSIASKEFSDQQIPDLVTLSLLPKTQWQSLINLDIIKIRNKPIEPPKKPEKVPFFLTTAPSLSGGIIFESSAVTNEDDADEKANEDNNASTIKSGSRKQTSSLPPSEFLQRLQSSADAKNFSAFTEYVKGLSPSLDMELRMLQIIDDDDDHENHVKRPELLSIELLLDFFIHEVSQRTNFEFIQALIRVFLKIHGETIRRRPDLREKARTLLEAQSEVWQKVDKLFQVAGCTVAFLSNSQF
ncbi:WD repeat-containing protein [Drosera capensis]